ncbi:MAG: TetR/AcrR family transcriptional regulator [Polaromonas sp.]|jgi:AcrR family transcriptional regulator|uniref:TetR/AcrR family transcriptional regulator n=1 Tax=Polaromonas sp. TaxID=1869339 RepID=UPI0024872958|nr:TetR/AcrR family transcriptional regulator [Polaromonas sp.]MDI1236546.1 TetR/AcrR family transcriptional regulator [Polaromonas sp.]
MVNMKSNTDAKPSKNDVDAPATRERVLLEAARLFRHHGYSATTLREVADAAGVKAGSIYYHFESKEQILGEVLDKGITIVADAVRTRIGALPESALWRDRIAAGIEGHLWGMLHYGDFTSANIRIYGQIPTSAKNRHRVVRRAYADYWDRLFESALASGELRPDTNTAMIRLFVIGALNWTVEWYNPQRGSFQDFSRQITAIVFDGILTHDKA